MLSLSWHCRGSTRTTAATTPRLSPGSAPPRPQLKHTRWEATRRHPPHLHRHLQHTGHGAAGQHPPLPMQPLGAERSAVALCCASSLHGPPPAMSAARERSAVLPQAARPDQAASAAVPSSLAGPLASAEGSAAVRGDAQSTHDASEQPAASAAAQIHTYCSPAEADEATSPWRPAAEDDPDAIVLCPVLAAFLAAARARKAPRPGATSKAPSKAAQGCKRQKRAAHTIGEPPSLCHIAPLGHIFVCSIAVIKLQPHSSRHSRHLRVCLGRL